MLCKKLHTTIVHPKAPYNFDYSVENPSHYPTPTGGWEPGKLWFTMKWIGSNIGIKFDNQGTVDKPAIKISIFGTKSFDYDKLINELTYRYEWDLDYTDFYNKFSEDKLLKPVIKKFRGMHGFCGEDMYDYIMITVFLQNTTAKRTAQMTQVMLDEYGKQMEFDGKKFFCFWKPEEMVKVPEQDLRDLKVGYRAKTFLRVSKDFVDGVVDEAKLRGKDIDYIREELLKIYGVGPASVMYIINDVFHTKVLDVIPPWEGKIYSQIFFGKNGIEPEKSMAEIKKRYGEYRALVVHHLFMDIAWKHRKESIKWADKLLPFR
jgi:3-methyladenine DNA glycosylase/8-oxoguanine DNA glycosylase